MQLAVVTSERRIQWIIPLGVIACYVLLTVAVRLGLLDAVDTALRNTLRPRDVWGPSQMRAHLVVQEFRPAHLLPVILVVTGFTSLLRRTLRPFAMVAAVGVLVVLVTLVTKVALARPDPHATSSGHGSFPSGHMVSLIVVAGLVLLLLRPDTRWGWILPGLLGAFMGWALVVVAMHWATDVLGGVLLAVAVLSAARAIRLGHWANAHRRVRATDDELHTARPPSEIPS